MVTSANATKLVRGIADPLKAAEKLANVAHSRWLRKGRLDDIVVAVEDLVGDGNVIAPEAVVAGNDYREVAHILMRGADVAFLFSFFGFSRSGTT